MAKARKITSKEDIDFLLGITEDTITKTLMMKMFGKFKTAPRFDPTDEVVIPPGSYGPEGKKNKNSVTTTVGIWVTNKLLFEGELFEHFKYQNRTMTGGVMKDMAKKISYLILEDKVELLALETFLQKRMWLMRFVSILSPNDTEKMLLTSHALKKKKEELFKKYKDGIEAGDEVTAVNLEKELLSAAKDYLKDDPAMDNYDSGARGKFDNGFKNMYLVRGSVESPDPTKSYEIITSNYMDGISKKDFATMADSLVGPGYSKAKATAPAGYSVKQFEQGFQHVVLDPPGSDCGTSEYITVDLTAKNVDLYMYCYIKDGSSLVELTSDKIDKYIGKTVKMRFSSVCESKTGRCNKCAGNLYYRLNLRNIGLTTTAIPSKILNMNLKKMHVSQVKLAEMDPMKAFGMR